MSLLPEKLIDVDASAGEAPRLEVIESATRKLLDASQGPNPYAGAIIRHALDDAEIEHMRMARVDHSIREPETSFLPKVNQVMKDWWTENPLDKRLAIGELHADGFATTEWVQKHFDQYVGLDPVIDGSMPVSGLLSATATVTGIVDYTLYLHNVDLFDQAGLDKFQDERDTVTKGPHPGEVSVQAHPGDLLLFTNTPPVLHGVDAATQGRATQIYFSYFEPAGAT